MTKPKACIICDGLGILPSDEPVMQMQGSKCWHCGGTGREPSAEPPVEPARHKPAAQTP